MTPGFYVEATGAVGETDTHRMVLGPYEGAGLEDGRLFVKTSGHSWTEAGWTSPAGYFCLVLSQLGEDGKNVSGILGFRNVRVIS